MDGVAIRLAGSFDVTCGDAPVAAGLGSRKARLLLMLLVVHRGRVVGVDRIVDALWDESPPRHPEQNVATLVSRLRAALGSDVIIGGRGGYRLGMPPAPHASAPMQLPQLPVSPPQPSPTTPQFAFCWAQVRGVHSASADCVRIVYHGSVAVPCSDSPCCATRSG